MFKVQRLGNLAISVCFIGPIIMVLSDVMTIVLNHKFDAIEQTISGFAAGPYGWLEKIGMMMVAITFLLMGLALWNVSENNNVHILKPAGILFMIAAFGFILTSLVNSNLTTTAGNFHFSFHRLSLLIASIGFYQACLIFTVVMTKKAGFKFFGIYSGFVYIIGLAAFIWIIFSSHHILYAGLAERILTGLNLLWIIMVGPQAIKLANLSTVEKHHTDMLLQPDLDYHQFETGSSSPVSPVKVSEDHLKS